MTRTQVLQEIRRMRFEETCAGWQSRWLTQEESERLAPESAGQRKVDRKHRTQLERAKHPLGVEVLRSRTPAPPSPVASRSQRPRASASGPCRHHHEVAGGPRPVLRRAQHDVQQPVRVQHIAQVREGVVVVARDAVLQLHESIRKPLLHATEGLHIDASLASRQIRQENDHQHLVEVRARRVAALWVFNPLKRAKNIPYRESSTLESDRSANPPIHPGNRKIQGRSPWIAGGWHSRFGGTRNGSGRPESANGTGSREQMESSASRRVNGARPAEERPSGPLNNIQIR